MTKAMILGAGGVFGNLAARHLLDRGWEVMSVGRSPLKPHFHLGVGNDNPKYQYQQIHIVHEFEYLCKVFDDYEPDYVINFAALAYANSWEHSALYYNTNCLSVVHMAEHLKKRDYLRKFVQIGSSEVYGSTPKPATEDQKPNPTSPYAVSKLAADMHLQTMKDFIPMNIIRPSNCYGEGQYTYRIMPKAILYMLNNMVFPLEGGGVAEKSFMHANDLSTSIELICEQAPAGEMYNVGPDKPISMREIIQEICRQLGKEFNRNVAEVPGRAIEDSIYWVDSSKIRRLGWRPVVSFEEGVASMIEWCEAFKAELSDEPDSFRLRA